jgi:hypothetical protein
MIVPVNAPENNTILSSPAHEINPEVHIPVISPKQSSPERAVETETVVIAASETKSTPAVIATIAAAEPVVELELETVPDVPTTSESEPKIDAVETHEPIPVAAVIVEEVGVTLKPVVVGTAVVAETASPAATAVADEVISPAAVEEPVVSVTPVEVPISTPEVATAAVIKAEPILAEAAKEQATPDVIPTSTTLPEAKTPPPASPTTVAKESSPIAEPTTPTKANFPSVSETSTPTGSPASSRFNSVKRQKRSSIFGKIKHIFHHDKNKDKEEKVKK